jgi:hypothetical protein
VVPIVIHSRCALTLLSQRLFSALSAVKNRLTAEIAEASQRSQRNPTGQNPVRSSVLLCVLCGEPRFALY